MWALSCVRNPRTEQTRTEQHRTDQHRTDQKVEGRQWLVFKEWLSGLLEAQIGSRKDLGKEAERELPMHRAGPGNMTQGAGRADDLRTEGSRVLAVKAAG